MVRGVLLSLGPLCEGAPAAAGGGENCTAARNISGYGKLSPHPALRGHLLPQGEKASGLLL